MITSKNSKVIEFCQERKKGASKIASQAEEKGGFAKLTAWHFKAKLPIYDECIEMIKENKKLSDFKKKFTELKNKINTLDQKEFQEVMGKLEVFGEVIAFLEK